MYYIDTHILYVCSHKAESKYTSLSMNIPNTYILASKYQFFKKEARDPWRKDDSRTGAEKVHDESGKSCAKMHGHAERRWGCVKKIQKLLQSGPTGQVRYIIRKLINNNGL